MSGWQGIKLSLISDKRYLAPVRALVRESATIVGLEQGDVEKVVLAVQEGLANVIRHCYKDQPHERIDVWVTFDDHEFEIQLKDYGEFVDPITIKSRDLEDVRPGGLGVHLMQTVMDEVKYEKNEAGGTTLTLRKRVPDQPPQCEQGEHDSSEF